MKRGCEITVSMEKEDLSFKMNERSSFLLPFRRGYIAKGEMELLKEYIIEKKDIRSNDQIAKHADWTDAFLSEYDNVTEENIEQILEQEVGKVFCKVLEDAGVYKCTDEGIKAFKRFISTL